jgi:hypothetical protein
MKEEKAADQDNCNLNPRRAEEASEDPSGIMLATGPGTEPMLLPVVAVVIQRSLVSTSTVRFHVHSPL